MKFKILIAAAIAALAGVIVFICVKNSKGSDDSGADSASSEAAVVSVDADTVKAFLNGLNTQALKNGKNKFSLSYSTKYSLVPTKDAEKNSKTLSREETGSAELCLDYSGSLGEDGKPSVSGMIKGGEGYLKGTMTASEKAEGSSKNENTADYSIGFTIRIDKTDVYAVGDVDIKDSEMISSGNKDSFSGKIDKKVLTDNLSEDVLENARSELLKVSDIWEYISGVSDIVGYAAEKLDLTDSKAVHR